MNTTAISETTDRKNTIDSLVGEIAAYSRVDLMHTGIAGGRSEQYQRYEWLSKKATEPELGILTNHESAVVSAYAFLALVERKSVLVVPAIENHLHDTSSFNILSGCVSSRASIGPFYVRAAAPLLSSEQAQKYRGRQNHQ